MRKPDHGMMAHRTLCNLFFHFMVEPYRNPSHSLSSIFLSIKMRSIEQADRLDMSSIYGSGRSLYLLISVDLTLASRDVAPSP